MNNKMYFKANNGTRLVFRFELTIHLMSQFAQINASVRETHTIRTLIFMLIIVIFILESFAHVIQSKKTIVFLSLNKIT